MMSKSYSEMKKLETFKDRFDYLKTGSIVGEFTFNGHRYLNQMLYKCPEWKTARRRVIIRDKGCDLGCEEYVINGVIVVHHINPITIEDILNRNPCVFDLENLVTTCEKTHRAIHYQTEVPYVIVDRFRNDTAPWRL